VRFDESGRLAVNVLPEMAVMSPFRCASLPFWADVGELATLIGERVKTGEIL